MHLALRRSKCGINATALGFQESSVFRGGIVGRQRKHWCKVVDSFSSLGLDKGKWTVETPITDAPTSGPRPYNRQQQLLFP